MITLPIIGVITVAQVGIWAAGGVASAAGAWLFRRIVKLRTRVNNLDQRLRELEK